MESTLVGMTQNKGEWAELYVFLKLLGEGKLYAADEHLRRKPNTYVDILRVLREEVAGELREYLRHDAHIEIRIDGVTVTDGEGIPASLFLKNADDFFAYLKDARPAAIDGRAKQVSVTEELAEFSKTIRVGKAKASGRRSIQGFGGKADIVIETRDSRSAVISIMGFSIKSQFASAPTLYNAGTSTQLLFEIEGMDDSGMAEFNSVECSGKKLWSEIAKLMEERGWKARFIGAKNPVTWDNLVLVRDSMPQILAWLYYHALLDYHSSDDRDLMLLTKRMMAENPLGYSNPIVYEKAVKDLLMASFSGMTGGTPWDGTEQVNGGYIVVLPKGDVLCYHANDREMFREYLFTQMKVECVGRTKYRWGKVEKDQGRFVLPLNGSLRFYSGFRIARGG